MTKYRQLFLEMTKAHAREFSEFMLLHDKYSFQPEKTQEEYNAKGQNIVNIIRNWEKKLCSRSESGQYSKYSANLSEKFWNEIRIHFPKIDFIGCKVKMALDN